MKFTFRLVLTFLLIGAVSQGFRGIQFLLNAPSSLTFIGGLALVPVNLSVLVWGFTRIWRIT